MGFAFAQARQNVSQPFSKMRAHFGRNARRYVAGSSAVAVVAATAMGGWLGLALSAPLAAYQVLRTHSHSDFYGEFTKRRQLITMAILGPFSATLLPTTAVKLADTWNQSPPHSAPAAMPTPAPSALSKARAS